MLKNKTQTYVPPITYQMQADDDCGPRTISAVTGADYDKVITAWPGGWRGSDRGKLGVPNDTPWDHFVALENLGISYSLVPFDSVQAGDIVLLHDISKPESYGGLKRLLRFWPLNIIRRFVNATLHQHWAIIHSLEPGSFAKIYMGNGSAAQKFTWQEFTDMLHYGWPYCVYRVYLDSHKAERPHKAKRWHRFIAKLTGKIV